MTEIGSLITVSIATIVVSSSVSIISIENLAKNFIDCFLCYFDYICFQLASCFIDFQKVNSDVYLKEKSLHYTALLLEGYVFYLKEFSYSCSCEILMMEIEIYPSKVCIIVIGED